MLADKIIMHMARFPAMLPSSLGEGNDFNMRCVLMLTRWICASPADARDCVFFMHGVLDTSMGWVSNGVTGSQAFAAYDQGFDVWLGNSRANPPRVHIGAPMASLLTSRSPKSSKVLLH